jgi:hypothetical protein
MAYRCGGPGCPRAFNTAGTRGSHEKACQYVARRAARARRAGVRFPSGAYPGLMLLGGGLGAGGGAAGPGDDDHGPDQGDGAPAGGDGDPPAAQPQQPAGAPR